MLTVMLVEDEYLVRQGIASLIDYEKFGLQLLYATEDGVDAWDFIQKQVPDILLTDINMPRMNGLQLAEMVREHYPQVHIAYLTGYDDFQYALSAVKLGIDDYLVKPFSKIDVEEMLVKIIKKIQKENQEEQVHQLLMEDTAHAGLEELIKERLQESDLTLKSLAQDLGYSPSYLSVLIKKELGVPFQDFLIQERIKKAKLYLLTTDLKIYEISEKVGFEDMNYFSHRFKQITGLTPRQFKKGGQG